LRFESEAARFTHPRFAARLVDGQHGEFAGIACSGQYGDRCSLFGYGAVQSLDLGLVLGGAELAQIIGWP
jgi:hypothetical protein